jgi:vacuolar-type H+-ATPase subunit F/Vma7
VLNARHVVALGAPEMAVGFALGAIPAEEARTTEAGVARLIEMLSSADIGVILADERFVNALPDVIRRQVMRRPTPVLVPVPRPMWGEAPGEVGAYILDLLQRAVGYRMRLR